MVELLKWIAYICLIAGGFSGFYYGSLIGDGFSFSTALPFWISGILTFIVFGVLTELLSKVREVHAKMFPNNNEELSKGEHMYVGKKTLRSIMAVIVAVAIIFSVWTFVINVGGAETPAKAIGEFMIAVKARDYDEARKYLTKDASSMYDRFKLDRFNQVFKSTAAINSPSSVEIRGDRATGVIGDGTGVLYNVNLERKSGKWRISTLK